MFFSYSKKIRKIGIVKLYIHVYLPCCGGLFEKNTSLCPWTGIFRKYPTSDWYICIKYFIASNIKKMMNSTQCI